MFTTTLMTTAPLGATEMYEGKYKSNDNCVQQGHIRTHFQSDHTSYTVWWVLDIISVACSMSIVLWRCSYAGSTFWLKC